MMTGPVSIPQKLRVQQPVSIQQNPSFPPEAGKSGLFRSVRFWVGLFVSLFWLTVMVSIWLRESGRMGAGLREMGISPEVLMVSFSQYEHSMWIEQNNRRLGGTYLQMKPRSNRPGESGEGYLLQNQTRMNMGMLGLNLTLNIQFEADMNLALEMETLKAHLELSGRELEFQAFVENNKFYYRVKSSQIFPKINGLKFDPGMPDSPAGRPNEQIVPEEETNGETDRCGSFALKKPILLKQSILPIISNVDDLEVGDSWITESADPLSGVFNNTIRIRVEARENIHLGDLDIKAWKISEKLGQIESLVWYDMKGHLLKRKIKGGFASGVDMIQTDYRSLKTEDNGFKYTTDLAMIDREYIRSHQDPELENRPLASLLPGIPGL
jgi:hypothetical protein